MPASWYCEGEFKVMQRTAGVEHISATEFTLQASLEQTHVSDQCLFSQYYVHSSMGMLDITRAKTARCGSTDGSTGDGHFHYPQG